MVITTGVRAPDKPSVRLGWPTDAECTQRINVDGSSLAAVSECAVHGNGGDTGHPIRFGLLLGRFFLHV